MLKLITKILLNKLYQFGPNKTRISVARHWGVKIGEGCRIYPCRFGSEPFLISIGNNCEITAGVTFVTHDGATWIFRKDKKFTKTKYGPIIIKDNCMIGINSIILPNIKIGPNSIIGAGSVVTKDVPENTVYAGNPARYICSTDEYLEKCKANNNTVQNDVPFTEKKKILMQKYKFDLY